MSDPAVHDIEAQSVTTFAPVVGTAQLNVLRNFAFGHWRGANRLAKLLKEHEELHAGEEFGPQFEDARSFATAAILWLLPLWRQGSTSFS